MKDKAFLCFHYKFKKDATTKSSSLNNFLQPESNIVESNVQVGIRCRVTQQTNKNVGLSPKDSPNASGQFTKFLFSDKLMRLEIELYVAKLLWIELSESEKMHLYRISQLLVKPCQASTSA